MDKWQNNAISLRNKMQDFLFNLSSYYLPHLFEELSIEVKRTFERVKNNKYFQIGFMVFIVSFLCFATTYFTNMLTVPLGGDYVLQIIPFAFHAYDDWHYFFDTGIFPLWDTSGMLGVNNIGAYSFYNLSSPWTLIYLLFPRAWIPQVQGLLQMVKITTAGVLFYAYLGSFNLQDSTRKIGAVAFAFCGTIFYFLWFHFLDVFCFLPLLLWGIERIFQKKGPFILILALVLIGFTNYFFLICFCTSSMVYIVFRVFQTWKTRNASTTLRLFAEGVIGYVTGLLIVSIILIPSLLVGLDIAEGRNGINFFLRIKDAENLVAILRILFVFPNSYEAAYPVSSFFLININCFTSNLYTPYTYNNTMSSIFVFTPLMLMLVPSILDSIKMRKWSHLIGCFGTMLMLFTPFAYYAFFGGTAIYGRWEIMAVCWILVFFLIHLERHSQMPRSYMDISAVFSIGMMILAYFIANYIQKDNPGIFRNTSARYAVIIYQIVYTGICYYIMRTNLKKGKFSYYVFFLVAIEAVIQGNATILIQGTQPYQNLAGGLANVNQETAIVNSLNNYDSSFFRLFSSTTDRGANNNQMRVGYNGMSTFNTNYNKNLRNLIVWSRINYNDSWSMSVNSKRYNLDALLGVKYYLLKEDDINIPYGFVDMATLDSTADPDLESLQKVLIDNDDNHKLYLNTRYIDTFFTYDTLVNSLQMNNSTSYLSSYENKNESIYLKYGILDYQTASDLKQNEPATYSRLSGATDTLSNDQSNSLIDKAENVLQTINYDVQVRIPNWSKSGLIVEADGITPVSLPETGFSPLENYKFASDTVYTAWSQLDSAHSLTNWGSTESPEYVIDGYLPYWTRIDMDMRSPVCSNADPHSPETGCYVSINARSGYSINFFLLDENGEVITSDFHYNNTYGGENDWQYARGFYVDRPVHRIVGFAMKDIKVTQGNLKLTGIFPKPSVQYSPYSDYSANTSAHLSESQHYNITDRNANALKFTTNFTEEKLHFSVMNIPFDSGWTLTRTMKKNGESISEIIPTYKAQGGLTGFEAINSDDENEIIEYEFVYNPGGLQTGISFTIIGLLMFYGLSMLYMGLRLNDKFVKYDYLNLRKHWYDKDVWEKNNKIRRRHQKKLRR